MARDLTREEAKLITRRRLIEAATKLLGRSGAAGLTTSAVAREAGVAQPTFYVHFRDKHDLLRSLAAEKIGALRERVREARARVQEAASVETVRETFRIPLELFVEDPELFHLFSRELRQPTTPTGRQARSLNDELRRDLAEDLVAMGLPARSEAERQRVEMIAEAMMAQTEALGLGYLEGRYSRLDDVIDVLTRFAVGILGIDAGVGAGRQLP